MKRIIVCCDGTSNTAYQSFDDSPRTNVFRISRYIKATSSNGTPQVTLYQPGVGTMPGSMQSWSQVWGIGIGVNIMAAYNFICLNYEPNDEIILIGYSRGAFTVRCIINIVDEIGLLTKAGLGSLHPVFDGWWKGEERKNFSDDIKQPDNWHPPPHLSRPGSHFITACGLWDTVDSVGRAGIFGPGRILGIQRGGAPSRVAGASAHISGVDNVFHALSLHERRSQFQPVMARLPARLDQQAELRVNLEQCWFSGYHADIGGGRRDDILAHSPLAWVMAKLATHIDFDFDAFWEGEKAISKTSLPSKSAEPRLQLLVDSELNVPDSMTLWWRLIGTAPRRPGTIEGTEERIHWSVYHHTFPFQADFWEVPSPRSLLKRCWAFQNVTLQELWTSLQLEQGTGQRRWRPREARPDGRTIEEAGISEPLEKILIQSWMIKVLDDAQMAATAPGTESNGTETHGVEMDRVERMNRSFIMNMYPKTFQPSS